MPNEKLPKELVARGLAMAGMSLASDMRKAEAWRRYLFLKEDYTRLIADRIAGTHKDPHTIDRLCQWVDVSLNLPLDILREICVVWNKPVRRWVEGASDEKNEALAKLYREVIRFDKIAQDFNRHAFFLGEATIVPRVIDGEVQLMTLLPYFYDTLDNPDNPTGDPWALVYTLREPNSSSFWGEFQRETQILRNGDAVVLDGHSFRRYKRNNADLVEESVHGLGRLPVATLRFSESMDGDRWSNYRQNRRLFDAGVKVGVIDAQMSWVRKGQNKHLVVATGQLPVDQDDPQTADPEKGMVFPTDNAAQLAIQSLNFDTDPANFIKHLGFAYQVAARSYGGSASVAVGTGGAIESIVDFPYESQTEIREDQIPYARIFEKDLCRTIIEVMAKAGHPMSKDLPTAEEIEDGFTADFGRLSRRFADVGQEIEYFEFKERRGIDAAPSLFDDLDPELKQEQRMDVIKRNLETTAEIHEFAAQRNMPMDGEGVKTLPEIQGELGPAMRDAEGADPDDPSKDESKDAPAKRKPPARK